MDTLVSTGARIGSKGLDAMITAGSVLLCCVCVCGVVWCCVVLCCVVLCGVVWCGVVLCSK